MFHFFEMPIVCGGHILLIMVLPHTLTKFCWCFTAQGSGGGLIKPLLSRVKKRLNKKQLRPFYVHERVPSIVSSLL